MSSSEPVPGTAAAVDLVVRTRRTSLLMDPESPVPADLVDRLIDAATWAPNHKRTWPWRFTVLEGEARARLGEAVAGAAADAGFEPSKVAKFPGKYRRSAVVLLVWVRCDDDPVRRREDRDAVAAGVQNLLLTATAHGLASYWASMADQLVPTVREVAGVDAHHDLVALVYLGRPIGEVATPRRPAPPVTRLR